MIHSKDHGMLHIIIEVHIPRGARHHSFINNLHFPYDLKLLSVIAIICHWSSGLHNELYAGT
jgi:hypothetical protein